MLLALWLVTGAAFAAAAALTARLTSTERRVLAGLCLLFAWTALCSPVSYVNDYLGHFEHAQAALRDPWQLLSTWDRPAFVLLYAAPAQLGLTAARLTSLAPAAIAVAGTMLAARALGLARPWLAGVLVAAQIDFFGQASSTMTELLFAAGLAAAIWALATRRPWVAALGLGAISIARPEGPLHAGVGALLLLARERRLGPVLAAAAPFALFLVAGAAAYGDPLWYVHHNAYGGGAGAAAQAGLLLRWTQLRDSFFYTAMVDSQPPVLLALEVAGALVLLVRGGRLRLVLVPIALYWLVLTFVRVAPFDWWRQSRYLVAVAPALALVAAAGLERALETFPAAAPPVLLLGAGASAAATVLQGRRLPMSWGAIAVLALFAIGCVAALALWAGRRRVPFAAAFALLLVLPLAASPPGCFARHRPTPGERLDLAALRWLRGRTPAPVAVGWPAPTLEWICRYEFGDPCPLPLREVSLEAAPPGTLLVRQFVERAAPPPPPGWRAVWSAEDGSVRGPQLSPRWAAVREVIWERE